MRGWGADFKRQIFGSAQPLLLASGVLIVLACLPGMPGIPFLLLGVGLGTSAWRMRAQPAAKGPAPGAAKPARENLEGLLKVEPLAIEVGLGLVKMVEGGQNSPLLKRISGIRRQLAADLGYLLPPVRVADNLALRSREYAISLKGAEIARYEMPQGCQLAIASGRAGAPPEGKATREPAFGLAAWWVTDQRAEQARAAGYTIVDPVSVLGTHVAELARRYA